MMTLIQRSRSLVLVTALLITLVRVDAATTFLWNVPTPGPNAWNVDANWLPGTGNPAAGDTAQFGAVGMTSDAVTVNNVVSVNTTIASLHFTNITSGTWNVTQIAD